jgi:hypothetical protein
MGERTILLGCIIEPHIANLETRLLVESHNRSKLFDLPEEDRWPPIHRSFFGSSQSEAFKGGYRGRVIHFGASLKNLLEDWDEWSDKFENLLRELIWIEAWLKVDGSAYGQRDLVYTASDEVIQTFQTSKPQKNHSWSVEKRFA